jgi:hypothetical protein
MVTTVERRRSKNGDKIEGEGSGVHFLLVHLPISSRQIDESISIADFFPPN